MDAIQESLTQLQNLFTQRMDVYQSELQAAAPSANVVSLTSEFAAFKQFIVSALRNLQDQVSLLAQQTDNMEMRSRRKILLLHGLPENKNEDTAAVVVKTVVDRLKIPHFSTSDISRCHRMGRISTPDKPRPILFKLHELDVKHKVWYSKKSLKGTGITLSEFLTRSRHDVFMMARRKFGLSKCWTHEGSIYILGANGVRNRITSSAELDKIDMPSHTKPTAPTKEPAGATRNRRAGNSNSNRK